MKDTRLLDYILENTEAGKHRVSYAEEREIMQDISDGNVDAVRARFLGGDIRTAEERVGRLAQKPLKNFEYMICASIVLASRAAIVGGLDADLAYSMADVYLQRLEQCQSTSDILGLHFEVMLTFTEEVKQHKGQRVKYSYIEKCKSYIDRHLNVDFTLEDIAKEVGVNKSYLSRRFSQEIGMGIFAYVMTQRIEAAKNMLRFSAVPLSEIAEYLHFYSQSHFGTAFKKYTGMTPQKFRNSELLVDFR